MLFNLAALSAADIAIAKSPEIGAESILKYSAEEVVRIGGIDITAAAASETDITFPHTVDAAGRDLHLRCDNGAKGAAGTNLKVTLTCTMSDDSTEAVVFEYTLPSWLTDGSNILPVGQSVDGVAASGLTIKAVTAIASVEGGLTGRSNKFSLWSSPASTTFILAGATREKVGPYQVPATVSIADRYNASAYTKKGRSEDKTLRITYPWVSSMEHIGRLNGHRSTVLVQVHKDDAVPFSNTLYTGYRPNASPEQGDGNDEVIATSEGPYESFLTFAPVAA